MKGKFIKKLTACALAVAMVVTTPVTASAAEFKDFFWISDGDTSHDQSATGTGTVSSTDTDTTVLDYNADITGIIIKEKDAAASAVVFNFPTENQKTLVAEIQYAGTVDEKTKKVIEEQITWRSSNLAIVRPAARKGSMATCPITAYKGGFANITAEIDVDKDGTADFMARVRVMVKKAASNVYLDLPNGGTLYAGHTYDLQKYVLFNDDAFDEVEFTINYTKGDAKKQKLVAFGKDGVLKLDKKIKDGELEADLTVQVKGNADVKDTKKVVFSAGDPVTGLSFTKDSKDKKNTTYDIAGDYKKVGDDYDFDGKQTNKNLVVDVKTKSGNASTDDITWTTSDSSIVRIVKVDGEPFNEKTEDLSEADQAKKSRTIRFEGLNVGKATVTATATSGKSAKINLTVTATLLKIESAEIDGDSTYSGKATPVVISRIPKQSNDKLKVTVGKDEKKIVKAKGGINPILTPAADLIKLNANDKEITTVTIEAANKKLNVASVTVKPFKVKQSDVKITTIMAATNNGTDVVKQKKVKVNPVKTVSYFAPLDTSRTNTPGDEAVSWESSKETVATVVDNGRIKVVGTGSAKITASSVYEDKPGKYKTIKKSFTIQATPKCEQIVFKSNVVTVKEGAKTAVVNIKEQLPKKAADNVQWYIYGADGKTTTTGITSKTDNKKCTIDTQNRKAGEVITVVAKCGAVEAEAKIIVVSK